jgi:5-methylcytosine-specific restriction endonuclease McrA
MPRAYLRVDPNIDQTHPDPGAMVTLLCAAARQVDRGRFRDRLLIERAIGKARANKAIARGDVVEQEDGRWYVQGWDEWQEGDHDVGTRMRRMRARRREAGLVAPRTGRERTADWRLKSEALERDGYACRYCGAYEYPREMLIAEHVIPHPDGPTNIDNIVTACGPCNVRKGGRTPEQAGMTLHPIGYRSAMDPLGDTPRVTRSVTRHDGSERVTVTTDAVAKESAPVLSASASEISPPPQAGRRKDGTNPRAMGTNPRANGTSPRQERQAAKRGGMPDSVAAILARAAQAGHE